jgi:hypothetical protein
MNYMQYKIILQAPATSDHGRSSRICLTGRFTDKAKMKYTSALKYIDSFTTWIIENLYYMEK